MPDTMLTLPPVSVEVRVERSSASLKLPEKARSKWGVGAAFNSSSSPWLRARGTLKTTREEQAYLDNGGYQG